MKALLFYFSLIILIGTASIAQELGFQSQPLHRFLASEAQSGSIEYFQPGDWSPASSADWLVLDGGPKSGRDAVGYSVAENATDSPRVGVIEVGTSRFEIIQNAPSASTVFGIGENELAEITGDGEPASINTMQTFWSGARDAQTGSMGVLILDVDGKLWGKGDFWSTLSEKREYEFRLLQEDVRTFSFGDFLYLFEKMDGSLWAAESSGEPIQVANQVSSYGAKGAGYFFITEDAELWAFSALGNAWGQLGNHPDIPRGLDEPVLLASDVIHGTVGLMNTAWVTRSGDLAIVGSGVGGLYKGLYPGGWMYDEWFKNRTTPAVVLQGVEAAELDFYQSILVKLQDGNLYEFANGQIEHLLLSDVEAFGVNDWYPDSCKWARNSAGEFFLWGKQSHGEFGLGTWLLKPTYPAPAGPGISNYTSFGGMGIQLKVNGDIAFAGQDRLEIAGTRLGMMPYAHIRKDVKWAYSDGQTSVFLSDGGELYMLGRNPNQRLVPNGDWIYTMPKTLGNGVIKAVPIRDSEGFGLYLLDEEGTAYMIGVPTLPWLWLSPLPSNPVAYGVKDIAADEYGGNYYYVTNSGTLFGLGSNSYGQLGEDPSEWHDQSVPIRSGVERVFAGSGVVAFTDQNAWLWAQGSNENGFVGGDNGEASSSVPVLVSDSPIIDVSFSASVMLYTTTNRDLFGLGRVGVDSNGVLSSEPVKIPVLIAKDVERGLAASEGLVYLKDGDLIASGSVLTSSGATEPDLIMRMIVDTGVTKLVSAFASSLFYRKDQALVTSLSFIEALPSAESWEGFERTIRVRSEQPWIARSEVDWIELSEATGEPGISEILIQVKPNSSRTPRIGYVSISGKRVQVYQQSEYFESVALDRSSARVSPSGEQIKVAIDSASDWTVFIDQDWIEAVPAEGSGSGQIVLSIAPNNTSTLRVADLFVNSELIQIRQQGISDGLGFDAWLRAYFTNQEIAAFGAEAADADPDLDGNSNEEEWLLGHSPDDYSSRLRYGYHIDGGFLRISLENMEPPDVEVRVEVSTDLDQWSEQGVQREQPGGSPPQFSIELEAPSAFVRFRVERVD